MRRTLVMNIVGLTKELMGDDTPHINELLAREGGMRPLRAILPAVTCSTHATFTTGLLPSGHGCVANGWYFRDLSEIWFWRQSNRLVQGEKIWEAAKKLDPSFTCAKLFFWYNMYSTADFTVTPRPMYPADGRKLPDIYAQPAALRDELTAALGTFPLFHFWGPAADITSSRWIANCAKHVIQTRRPTLTLVYLPHLDYCLQRLGPKDPGIKPEIRRVDALAGELIDLAKREDMRVIILSEYGITEVRGAVHINRALREAGLLEVRTELGRELLDPGISEAFAVADHQIAHIYVRRPERVQEVKGLVERIPGVERVLGEDEKREAGLDHPRSGELVAVSRADTWFSYYYWLDDEKAPDFARTVDIHRKPGYDPVELFLDPKLVAPKVTIGLTLLKKKLGLRTLMEVIPLDVNLVKGSHGRITDRDEEGPVIVSSAPELLPEGPVGAQDVKNLILKHVF